MKTIPEIAEDLRTHIHNDNDAKRLIVEHILPLLGADFGSLEELVNAPDRITELEGAIILARKEVRNAVATLDEIITESALSNDSSEDSPISGRLANLQFSLDNTIGAYLTLNP